MRLCILFLISILGLSVTARAQDPSGGGQTPSNNPAPSSSDQASDTTGASGGNTAGGILNPFNTLANQFFEGNYVNFFAYGGGLVDFNAPILGPAGQNSGTGFGYSVGGGVSLFHAFHASQVSLGYSVGYNDYTTNNYVSGTSQNLNLGYSQRLTRRISMQMGVSAGEVLYGTTAYVSQPISTGVIVTNPFSATTKYLGASVGFNFAQTRRLSYGVYGSYFLSRYNYPGSIGSTGASGGGSVNYRLTARDTISAVYGYSYFTYQRNAGGATNNSFGANYGHLFRSRWSLSAYAGVGRSDANGFVQVPVTLIVNGQTVGGYVIGKYNQVATYPSWSVSASRALRKSAFSIAGGEGFSGAGNGYFLASKSLYLTGLYSFSVLRQNISVSGSLTRLTSVANTVTSDYSSANLSASYGHMLFRHVGAYLRYDYVQYGSLKPFNGAIDNRISFGFNFSTRSIPITLF